MGEFGMVMRDNVVADQATTELWRFPSPALAIEIGRLRDRQKYLEMQLEIGWDALGDIVQQCRLPEHHEQPGFVRDIARSALEKLNNNMIERKYRK
jgi:hypothetical protein